MAEMAEERAGYDEELHGRINQIERDLARILRGMDAVGNAGIGAPSPMRQTYAVETVDQASAGVPLERPVPNAPFAMLHSGFEARPASNGPQGFTRSRARFVRGLIRQRRERERHFPADMFADPAWDMLLDLYAAHYEGGKNVSVSSLCIAAAVPATTALRWIKTMTDAGYFVRVADPNDGRRIFIQLAETTRAELDTYFNDYEG